MNNPNNKPFTSFLPPDVVCCGGPAMGTDHAPDCPVILYLETQEHDECESCGSDEGVQDGLCIDCAEESAEWDANAGY